MSWSKLNESLTKFQLRPFALQLPLRLFSSQSWRSAQSIREKKSSNHKISVLFRYLHNNCTNFKIICYLLRKSLFEILKPWMTSLYRLEKENMTTTVNHWLKTYGINILYRPIKTATIVTDYLMTNKSQIKHGLKDKLQNSIWLRANNKGNLKLPWSSFHHHLFYILSQFLYFPWWFPWGMAGYLSETAEKATLRFILLLHYKLHINLRCWVIFMHLFSISEQQSIYIQKYILLEP